MHWQLIASVDVLMDISRLTQSKMIGPLLRSLNRKRRRFEKKRRRRSWERLKGCCSGQRGWVIGNGPSLKVEDLDRLQGEVCIASNKIYLAFEQTKWRPTFFTIVDEILWPKIADVCAKHFSRIIIPEYLTTKNKELESKLLYLHELPAASCDPAVECMFSPDLVAGSNGGYTVTYTNLQLAHHLGLNPIYIIGCDHYYAGEKDVTTEEVVEAKAANHFHPDYRKQGELVSPASIDRMDLAFEHARTFADQNGIRILNATRGGHLEAFERVQFDDVLNEPTPK